MQGRTVYPPVYTKPVAEAANTDDLAPPSGSKILSALADVHFGLGQQLLVQRLHERCDSRVVLPVPVGTRGIPVTPTPGLDLPYRAAPLHTGVLSLEEM